MAIIRSKSFPKELADELNARVRELPFNADEVRALAKSAGVSERQARAWVSPEGSAVTRPLIPAFALKGPMSHLSEEMLARIEFGLSNLVNPSDVIIGTVKRTKKAALGHKKGGTERTSDNEKGEVYSRLKDAMDRIEQYQRGEVGSHVGRHWTKIRIEPEEGGGWRLIFRYLSGVVSPKARTKEEHESDEYNEEEEYNF